MREKSLATIVLRAPNGENLGLEGNTKRKRDRDDALKKLEPNGDARNTLVTRSTFPRSSA